MKTAAGITFARGTRLFLICLERHICSKQADQKAPFKEMQSKMFSLPWQRRCLHLQLCKHRLSSSSQETRRTRQWPPCFVEITIIVNRVWKYHVCEELLPVSPVISWLAKNRAKCWSEPADVTQTNTKKNVTETSGTMRRYFKTTSERLPAHTDSENTFKSFTHFSSGKYLPASF